MKYFFANWKENLNYAEACLLLAKVIEESAGLNFTERSIVLLPPSTFLIPFSKILSKSHVLLGVQNVSRFEGGSYTGETSAKMIKPYAKYVLLGHSERRTNFGETFVEVNRKIKICIKEGLLPVVCVSSRKQLDEVEVFDPNCEIFLVYEPAELIGGEETQKPDRIAEFYQLVKAKMKAKFIYGGSVNDRNAADLLRESYLDGLLIGHSSLDAGKFGRIIKSPI